ncbi:putative deacetylase LmbE-like domain-containing protein [Aspergillus karnatakaensis]|uniref:PIG-L family deacetylase n=1 Tax=Aspergillus karnatakaensis TaxID=1810916 RepID=UPI003CCCEF03
MPPPQTLLSIGFALAAVFLFWSLSSTTTSPFARTFPTLRNKRICLLIAHPDDEAMFFAPTLLALTKPELGNHVKILCLSTGDADGLGPTRRIELQKSAKHLGLRSENDVLVLDETRFRDGMDITWAKEDITDLLFSTFAPNPNTTATRSKRSSQGDAPTATIDALITFDTDGISSHINHRSLYHGAKHFLSTLMKDKRGYSCPVTLYTLTSTNIARKYIGVLDAPITMVSGLFDLLSSKGKGKGDPVRLLFVSSINEWIAAQGAMVKAHKSQMVWFRWGWISLGRYMVVNDLRRERV